MMLSGEALAGHTLADTATPGVVSPLSAGALAEAGVSTLADYWALVKPNVMQLVLFTGWVGLFLAPGDLHPLLGFTALLCIGGGAAASAAINNWFDADIDRQMTRTRRRPTASGRIAPEDALQFGIVMAILSVLVMGIALNWAAAALLAFTIAFYVFVYTIWLKRRTPQNIVIGGAAGAFPPMVGWAAVTGDMAVLPGLMFLVIFLWTPPHFWALALYRAADYGTAGVPMLPVVSGRRATLNNILAYTIVVVAVSLLPWALGDLGPVYAGIALLLGGIFLGRVIKLWRGGSDVVAMRVFRFSILYLFLLFAGMVADRLIMSPGVMFS